jgi:hypothetical protein
MAPAFPSLRNLELGLCQLKNLEVTSPNLVGAERKQLFPQLESLNFDTNNLCDWLEVCKCVKMFPRCVIASSVVARLPDQTDVLTPCTTD